MTTGLAQLKHRLKRGPRMSRRLSDGTIAKLKVELDRLAASNDARVRRFVQAMAERHPAIVQGVEEEEARP
jgi:hypothetical protein